MLLQSLFSLNPPINPWRFTDDQSKTTFTVMSQKIELSLNLTSLNLTINLSPPFSIKKSSARVSLCKGCKGQPCRALVSRKTWGDVGSNATLFYHSLSDSPLTIYPPSPFNCSEVLSSLKHYVSVSVCESKKIRSLVPLIP